MNPGVLRIRSLRRNYRTVVESEAGRAVLEDLRAFCHADSPTYVSGDTHATAFQEGMRRVYLRFVHLAKLSPEDIERITQLTTGMEDRE